MSDEMIGCFSLIAISIVIALFAVFRSFSNAKKIQHLEESIEGISTQLHQIQKELQGAMSHQKFIENNAQEDFGHLSGMNDVDEKRIISLFKEGWSVDSIAKELRIGRGEVEFTLKIADI